MSGSDAVVAVKAWKPPVAGVREVLHARFVDHVYPPHTHDAWTLFLVDSGAVRYDLDRKRRGADASMVSVLPPHVVHDGRAATADGYRKRVVYLEASLIGEDLIGPAVDRPALRDPGLPGRVGDLHEALACVDDAFEAETILAFVVERVRRALGDRLIPGTATHDRGLAEALRAFLDDRLFERVTLAAAATELGAGPTQLARAFRQAFGIAPHAYQVGRRLDAARDRLLAGQALADVAAEVGFFDQAHLTHRFRRFLGVTPARFARGTRDPA